MTEEQQLRQANAELVAQSNVTKQRNLQLEKKNKTNQERLKELDKDRRESSEHFKKYQSQVKEDKEKAETEIFNLEKDKKHLENELEKTIEKFEQMIRGMHENHAVEIKELKTKMQAKEDKEAEYDSYLAEKSDIVAELTGIKERLAAEKALRLEQVNQKELDRIKETEQLRKEMLFNIKKTKANLLAMNDKQLQTTTHLTILQNHQLTTELEHQSK